MNFDRNTVIGFVVLALLFFGYFYYTNKEQSTYRKQKAFADSVANANRPKQDTLVQKIDSARIDSIAKVTSAGDFKSAADGTEDVFTVSNRVFVIAFTNKGGQPKWVELKNFTNREGKPVRLAASEFDRIDYGINTAANQSARIASLYFEKGIVTTNPDSAQVVSFTLARDSAGPSIVHQFVIRPGDYMIDFTVQMNGADKLLSQGVLNVTWQYKAIQQEKDINFEKTNTQVGYLMDDEFDYHTIGRRSDKQFEKPVKWVGVRQQFFNSFLVAKNNFASGKIEWTVPPNSEKVIMQSTANMRVQVPIAASANVEFNLFYGPADYHILKNYNQRFEKLINLGQGPYAFVRPLNRFVIMPIFDFFRKFVNSYGIVILLLTFFIRLIISPLTYSSYLSGAKMKVLRPEIQKLKEKYGKDQQQMSMEQMKLFREAGVNPLGGCIPALLQIPIFFALYSFFNSNIALRGQSFLWADDLSTYDSILEFGNIPLISSIYGTHVSLFTITACLTSFLISIYSMSMTPDQSNPVLKYMPYIFPFFLLFIFNRLPSALTWYYTCSNIVTLVLQFIIQRYIINHDKILAKIEETRKKPKVKSKWQEKFEQMQETQKKMKETQGKSKR